jgi:hypothetical protein
VIAQTGETASVYTHEVGYRFRCIMTAWRPKKPKTFQQDHKTVLDEVRSKGRCAPTALRNITIEITPYEIIDTLRASKML